MTLEPQAIRGFSLLELVVVIVLIGIVVAAGSGVIGESVKVTRNLNDSAAIVSDTRAALDRIARESRAVAWDEPASGTPGYLFVSAGASSVQFQKASGGPVYGFCRGVSCPIGPKAADTLYFLVDSTATVLLENVTDLTLAYEASLNPASSLNSTDLPLLMTCPTATPPTCLSLPSNIRLVQISLTISRDNGGPLTLSTVAAMRSR